jgi:hypothetical protein
VAGDSGLGERICVGAGRDSGKFVGDWDAEEEEEEGIYEEEMQRTEGEESEEEINRRRVVS